VEYGKRFSSTYSVRSWTGYDNEESTISLRLNETLNLSLFQELCFAYRYRSKKGENFDPRPVTMEVRMERDSLNYYSNTIPSAMDNIAQKINVDYIEGNPVYTYIWETPWSERFERSAIPCGGLGVLGWRMVGTLDWSQIQFMRFIIHQKVSSTIELFLDNLMLDKGRMSGSTFDIPSMQLYGLRTGPRTIDTGLKTDDECQARANAMVQRYKDPEYRVSIDSKSNAAIPLAQRIYFPSAFPTLSGKTFSVREADLDIKGLDVNTRFEISSSPYYYPKGYMDKKFIETERFKRDHENRMKSLEESSGIGVVLPKIKILYVGDDFEVSTGSTDFFAVKKTTVVKGGGAIDVNELTIVADNKQAGGGTAWIGINVDGNLVNSISTTSESYVTQYRTVNVRSWSAGRHTVSLDMKVSGGGITAYNSLFELYVSE